MFDPFGSMNGFMSRFQQFMGNPMQFMMQQKMGIPQEYANDPGNAIQYLLNNGKLSQEQLTWAQNTAQQIQNNPMFSQFMNSRK